MKKQEIFKTDKEKKIFKALVSEYIILNKSKKECLDRLIQIKEKISEHTDMMIAYNGENIKLTNYSFEIINTINLELDI